MKITNSKLNGPLFIEATPRTDSRGYFMRTFDIAILKEAGVSEMFVQENQSLTLLKHTIRGLHFQRPPNAEGKLIRVVTGSILDVFVDLREGSPTYGQWDCLELSADNNRMVYVPRGFAHGFCSLSDNTTVVYKVDAFYAPQSEGGILWNDPNTAIHWPTNSPVLSDKDRQLTRLLDIQPIRLS